LNEVLEWYVHLASQPGWKEYVWHQVNELAKEHPSAFRDLPAELTQEMRSRKEQQ
jgi:hypothetical protein